MRHPKNGLSRSGIPWITEITEITGITGIAMPFRQVSAQCHRRRRTEVPQGRETRLRGDFQHVEAHAGGQPHR